MPRLVANALALVAMLLLGACASHLIPDPPAIPPAYALSEGEDYNAGRVQSIAISPGNRRTALVAMEFGGIWKTTDGGDRWSRVYSLPTQLVTDLAFGADGSTVVATVARDNQVENGAGIFVSRDRGETWIRRAIVPPPSTLPTQRTSAYSVSNAPDEDRVWYAGTDYGVAISRNNGVTWSHVVVEAERRLLVQSVLGLSNGRVLALTGPALYRSDDHGTTWRKVVDDSFSAFSPMYGGNKMDRSPYRPWAFIFKEYHRDNDEEGNGSGSIFFYELDTDTLTEIDTPQGNSRGPFVRVSADTATQDLTIWIGHGWDGYKVTRRQAAEFRALTKSDWASFINPGGERGNIHADMSDLGVDGQHRPTLMGSDGGIFKPTAPLVDNLTGDEWMSAAVPSSGMNSLQITDLAGTNIRTPTGSVVSTSLYFGTQDNRIWASPDGGQTWPVQDCAEGFDLEVRQDALPGEPVQVGYAEIGCDWGEQFADANLLNQRLIPDIDQNGQPLDEAQMKQAFYLGQTSGGTESGWVRWRVLPTPEPPSEIYVSTNSGANWRKRFELGFRWAGSVQRTNDGGGLISQAAASARVRPQIVRPDIVVPRAGAMAWTAVFAGVYGPVIGDRIGLVPLSDLYADRIDAIDDSDIVLLPGSGSLGRVFLQWDWHAVFGADPYDWRFVIAPDVVAGDVKVTRDGGQTWTTDNRLTTQALRGGTLLMRAGDDVHMQVTKIAFDPYRNGRILVGTRDAGIICTVDDGQTWRTISRSDRIGFITGFHFYPNGAVHISSWGHGIWRLNASSGCSKTDPPLWLRPPIVDTPDDGGVLEPAAQARPIQEPPAPRGVADPKRTKLFLSSSAPIGGGVVLGRDSRLTVSGRGLPASGRITLLVRGPGDYSSSVDVDANGRFSTMLQLPANLPYGVYTVEAVLERTGSVLAIAEFAKSFAEDEELERGERAERD